MPPRSELLAPAGSFDAALAAFQYGADAVYLGLSRHSARAEAVNFTPEQLASITAYAHALTPRRAVYVAVNTLVRDDELEGVIESLDAASQAGVDGVILQDFAVLSLIRRFFPNLKAHASTQMAIHNREGAEALAELGFSRVVLARELSFDEIRDITRHVPIETEVFIHGALCYSYSGLCLFSALKTHRSGNRGRCAYCCRGEFCAAGSDGKNAAFPFSMRDLSLYDSVRDMRDAGVASLKIEGRMKSPLYVAAVTDLYRRKLDGKLEDSDAARAAISDMQTVFCRPTTRLHFDGKAASEDVIDAAAVGHRGAFAGHVHAVRRDREGRRWLCFAPQRPLEAHDGLQIEYQTDAAALRNGRPFGFSVESMRLAGDDRTRFSVPSRSRVEILLPEDAPIIPQNAKIFCTSSQAVHRDFAFSTPPAAQLRAATPVACSVTLSKDAVTAAFTTESGNISASASEPCSLTPARQPEQTKDAVQKAFSRLGDTRWSLSSLELHDPDALYAPSSVLNAVRRKLCESLDAAADAAHARLFDGIRSAVRDATAQPVVPARAAGLPLTSVKTTVNHAVRPYPEYDETVVALTVASCRSISALISCLVNWRRVSKSLRISLPLIVRGEEAVLCEAAVKALIAASFDKWECCDIAGLHLLKRLGADRNPITADGFFYSFNRLAAGELASLGIAAAVAPAETEDGQLIDMGSYAANWIIVPVRWRPPMFIAEARPVTPWTKEKPEHIDIEDRRGWRGTVDAYDGRWLTRDVKAIDRSGTLPEFRNAGLKMFRYDYTD